MNIPKLNDGEIYIGAIISADGSRNHHLILLPDLAKNLCWKDAIAWAESIGGEIPDRVESDLLFAHVKDQFDQEWYWTREDHAADSSYVWFQSFGYGIQGITGKDGQLRARAVRRVLIEEKLIDQAMREGE